MINSFTIANFKAFGHQGQSFRMKPLTIILGPNSSGKSSILHSLLFIHEAILTGKFDVEYPTISEGSVDLGGFNQYIFGCKSLPRRDATWTFEINIKDLAKRSNKRIPEQEPIHWEKYIQEGYSVLKYQVGIGLPEHGLVNQQSPEPVVKHIKLHIDDQLLLAGRYKNGSLKLEELAGDNIIIAKEMRRCYDQMCDRINVWTAQRYSENVEHIVRAFVDTDISLSGLFPSVRVSDPMISGERVTNNTYTQILPKIIRKADSAGPATAELNQHIRHLTGSLEWILWTLFKEVEACVTDTINRLKYLGPLRSFPPRHMAFAKADEMGTVADGGQSWYEISRDDTLRANINKWLEDKRKLKTPYQLILKRYYSEESLLQITHQGRRAWNLDQILRDNIKTAINDMMLMDMRTKTVVSHRDVGIGISQVLPVLVAAYGSKGKVLAIEQPEIHLHPALQAELADVFIESALGGNKNYCLLETHSEHFILRLLRRIREASQQKSPTITPDDVCILYVHPTESGSKIMEMRISKDGQFLDPWPGGFFPERLKEIMGA